MNEENMTEIVENREEDYKRIGISILSCVLKYVYVVCELIELYFWRELYM